MDNAFLPEALVEVDMTCLRVGQSAWTVPWIMFADADRKCWINTRYSPSHEGSGGTVDALVTRLAGGWKVDVSRSTHQWRPGGHVSTGDGYEPVLELIWQIDGGQVDG